MAKRKHTQKYLKHQSQLFRQLQKKSEVFDLLKLTPQKYKKLTEKPQYHSFSIGKKSGGKRQIEDPYRPLKQVQSRLNRYLQAVYYFYKTPLAYGFVLNTSKEKDQRDILTNARLHFDQPYMVNLDLKDFFHSIEVRQVWQILGSKPFNFNREAYEALTRLMTFRGRLPMGAPTSPVLSNFATRDLDAALHDYAQEQELVVSRYADDISFSGQHEISTEMLDDIRRIIGEHGFQLNDQKIKFYTEADTKEVTGILLLPNHQLGLPEQFVPELEQEIEQLAAIMLVQNRQGKLNTEWVSTFREHIKGKINFLGYVLGTESGEKSRLLALFNKASFPPPEDFGSYSWRSFHYHIQ